VLRVQSNRRSPARWRSILATVSIPRALAAVDGLWDFDPDYGGDPARFASVHRWRKALARGGAEACDPELMTEAMCALCVGAALRVALGPAPVGERQMMDELRETVVGCLYLAQELAEMLDEANGSAIWPAFVRRTDAMIAGLSHGVGAVGAEARGRLN
jgi:hypothetical protein